MARFLVYDHDVVAVSALSKLLALDGHEVVSHTRPEEAVDALNANKFDAVVTDVDRGTAGGRTVVEVVRDRHPSACLAVMTSRSADYERQLMDAGVCMVADKPVEYDSLVLRINDCRRRGGPGGHFGCHMKSANPPLSQLRRR